MPSDLKYKAMRAAQWTFIEAVGLRGVQFVIGIILARLLLPEQFGLIGMLVVFMGVAQVFLDSGFGAALIQKQNITQKEISSIFYFNILVGFIVTGCLWFLAPMISAFYEQSILTPLLRAMSLALVINAFGLVQNVLLRKALDFKKETKISLLSSLLSGIIGVSMAYRGFGVWSLATQQIANAGFRTTFLWFFNSWRPIRMFSFQSLQGMFGFGSKLLCASLLNTIFDNVYLVIIGKLFSPAALGYYARADSLQKLPSLTLSSFIPKVVFPVFCTIQNDPERMKRGMKKALAILVMVNFPLMIGLAIVAKPLVLLLLTDKWAKSVPYLQLLCMVGLMYPIHGANLNILSALGRSDLFLRLQIVNKILIAINITVTWRWGIIAMIIGQIIITLVTYSLNAYCNKILLNYSVWEQIKDIFPYLITALIMGGVVYVMFYLPIKSQVILLMSQVLVGGIVYVCLCRIFCFPAYLELQQMAVNLLPYKRVR